MSDIKVITSVQRRRRWTAEEKRAMVEEAEQPGMRISSVARRYDVHPNLLFTWRRLMREGALEAVRRDERVVPVSEVKALKARIRELERMLDRKTVEAKILKEAWGLRGEKTVIAGTLIQRGGYPVRAITETLGVSRSYQYEKRRGIVRVRHYKKADDERYLALIRKICDKRPTYGHRRVLAVVNRSLRGSREQGVNHKRVCRIMKIYNLLLQRHTGRPTPLHEGTVITPRSNARWCSDVFEIACWNGKRVRVAFCMDCADREVLSYIATTGGIHRDIIKDLMTEAIEYRFGMVDKLPHPVQWLSDNAPAYTVHETRAFARNVGLDVCTTPFHSPESNGMAEAFIKTFKRDYVRMHELPDAVTVMEQLPLVV